MKIAVSSYSFLSAMRDGRMKLVDVIPKAKELGFEGIEIASLGGDSESIRSSAPTLLSQSKAYGMPIAAYLTSGDFVRGDLDQEVERVKKEVEVAALIGATKMRHDACWTVEPGTSFESVLPRIVEGYSRVTEYAAGLGVHTMIENHGQFVQDSDRVEAIVKGVNHKNFSWLVDIGNFLCVDEDPKRAVTVGMRYAGHVHAKDFHMKGKSEFTPELGWFGTRGGNHLRGAIFGHGNMDVTGIMSIVRESGYDGWISLEFEGVEDCLLAVQDSYKNLKRLIAGE